MSVHYDLDLVSQSSLSIKAYLNLRYEIKHEMKHLCVEVLRPSQPNGVMSSAVSLPNHTFTGQA